MTTWRDMVLALEGTGISLTQLGETIGLSPQSLSDIKQGRSKEPRGMAAVNLHGLYQAHIAPEARAALQPSGKRNQSSVGLTAPRKKAA